VLPRNVYSTLDGVVPFSLSLDAASVILVADTLADSCLTCLVYLVEYREIDAYKRYYIRLLSSHNVRLQKRVPLALQQTTVQLQPVRQLEMDLNTTPYSKVVVLVNYFLTIQPFQDNAPLFRACANIPSLNSRRQLS
jgi:hypothetical protein